MSFLYDALVFLAAAAIAVPLSKRWGFGAVLGYLAAGMAIGPHGVGLIGEVEEVLHFSEIGVVFLLFIIGLELKPARLWVLRKSVFGFGSLQVATTGCALMAIAVALGLDPGAAFVVGFGLSLSSTAFVLQMLAEKRDLTRPHGRAAFGILLFQDLAVIPLIAVIPLLAAGEMSALTDTTRLDYLLTVVAVLGLFIVGGHFLLRPLLRLIAATEVHEIFTAAALLLVIGAALLMQSIGISMGLGAFLAGVLVADSEYRPELETDITPFKGLLLGLFFMAVGMAADIGLLRNEWPFVLALAGTLILLKSLILIALARVLRFELRSAIALGVVLSQGGEFAFVLFNIALNSGVLDADLVARLILAVTVSMAATPPLYLLTERVMSRLLAKADERPFDVIDDRDHEVIIAGFGRFGQIVARLLTMKKIPFTALENNPQQIDFVKRFGNKIYYGDPRRLDLLRAAHADRAKIFVLAVDDPEASIQIAEMIRHHFPKLALYARARNRHHALALRALGAKVIIRDTLLTSVELARNVLEGLGIGADEAQRVAETFKAHDSALLDRQYAFRDDEDAIIQSAKDSARELQELFESDAAQQSSPPPDAHH